MSPGAPWMLLLLPLVVAVGWLMARATRLQHEAACHLKGGAPEQGNVALGREGWKVLTALVCVVVALAQPQWDPRPYDRERRGRDLVVALDVSRSMLAADVFPSRLEMARIAIHEALPTFRGHRVALVTFAGSASVRVPLTLDHGFVRYMLERADPTNMDVGSTSLQAAIEKVASSVLTDGVGGKRDLVVFTDGEDHLSDIEKTAELLARTGVRVLIIGLGDPVRGAPVPDARDAERWMQHNGADVISRLDEKKLIALADRSSNVTYYAARARPFDLVPLYRQLTADAGDEAVVGGVRQVRYTEGYPYLLVLAVVLWLASLAPKPPRLHALVLIILLVPGCNSQVEDQGDPAFQTRCQQGSELLRFAREQSGADAFAERLLLVDAREQFLRAGLLRPGHIEAARQITAITARLRELDKVIEKRRGEERQQREKLDETIQRIETLTERQQQLCQRSRRALRRPPIPSGEQANLPEPQGVNAQVRPRAQLKRLALPISTEQRAVRAETSDILDSITHQQETLRQLLRRAYGDVGELPRTEVDPVAEMLTQTVAAQGEALARLSGESLQWPQANTALHTAAGRMQQALEALRSLQPPVPDAEDEMSGTRRVGDYDEDMDAAGTESRNGGGQAVSPGDFHEALSLRTLPIPDYTSAEIMAEEAANRRKRAQRNAARAGAKVEKNW